MGYPRRRSGHGVGSSAARAALRPSPTLRHRIAFEGDGVRQDAHLEALSMPWGQSRD